ncbi:hypothetical protein BGZ51_008804 [Haplosporangium sp. Z 767]|nr:hypothetical protein BGZ50_008957 [Haplosporangium sp. Z 11]KAF9177409.1 hypothetical protein BGZ51_008804 [Haplosporangium sp. Z 767]
MFNEDSGYQSVIDNINKVQSHGLTHKLSIPKMAIIGDQSSGKSSVLEAITKLSFPRDKEMCTRFATMVNLRRNPALQKDVLTARIEGEDEFNNLYNTVDSTMTFHDVIERAVSVLCKEKKIDISDKVLELTLSGPTQSPLTIIDLPGFINTTLDKQDKRLPDTINAINRRYIKEPRTIIIAVVQATADLNTSRALSEAGAHDPEGERTIPIVTKPDYIQNGLHPDWIEVLLNRRKTMKLGYLVMRNTGYDQKAKSWDEARQEEEKFFESDLWNAVPADRKGRVAVKKYLGNLLYEHISRELPILKREVDAALDTFKRDLEALGTPIATTDEARDKLTKATLRLLPQVIGFLNADYDHEYIAAFKEKPIPSSGQDRHFVRSSLLRLYHGYSSAMSTEGNRLSPPEIVGLVARYKGNDLPGFVSFTTFKNIINGHFLDGWRSITKKHVHKMHRHLSDVLSDFIAHTADAIARDVFTHVFDRFSRLQVIEIEKTIQNIFEDESTPFTLSRHYLDAIHEERSKTNRNTALPREPSISDMNKGNVDLPPASSFATPQSSRAGSSESSQSSRTGLPEPPQSPQTESPESPQPLQTGSPESPQPSQIGSPKLLQPSKNSDSAHPSSSQQQNNNWNDVHTTDETVPCLRAYLKTARERIVDKVLMETIERHMIKRIHDYFDMLLNATNGELQCMLESPMLKRRRQDLETKVAEFKIILNEL